MVGKSHVPLKSGQASDRRAVGWGVGECEGRRSHLEVFPLALQDRSLEEEDLLGGQAAVTAGGGKKRRRSALLLFLSSTCHGNL